MVLDTEREQFTRLDVADASTYPPKNALIDWITSSGQIVRGRWAGGAVWYPEGSTMYIYYTPLSWRLVPREGEVKG